MYIAEMPYGGAFSICLADKCFVKDLSIFHFNPRSSAYSYRCEIHSRTILGMYDKVYSYGPTSYQYVEHIIDDMLLIQANVTPAFALAIIWKELDKKLHIDTDKIFVEIDDGPVPDLLFLRNGMIIRPTFALEY